MLSAFSKLAAFSNRFLGATRGLYVPFGIAALLIMGVRLGADESTRWLFDVVSLGDRAVEWFAESVLSIVEVPLLRFGWVEPSWAQVNSYRFFDWIDMDSRESIAKYASLGIELFLDFLFIRLAFSYDEPKFSLAVVGPNDSFVDALKKHSTLKFESMRSYGSDLNVEKLYLPIISLFAAICGAAMAGLSVENVLYASISKFSDPEPWVTQGAAGLVMVALLWRFGIPVAVFSFSFADERMRSAKQRGKRGYRLLGTIPALVCVPTVTAGLVFGTPVGTWLGLIQ